MLNWIVCNRTDYLYKKNLALNNRQRLICHKTQPTKIGKFLTLFSVAYIMNCSMHIFSIWVIRIKIDFLVANFTHFRVWMTQSIA